MSAGKRGGGIGIGSPRALPLSTAQFYYSENGFGGVLYDRGTLTKPTETLVLSKAVAVSGVSLDERASTREGIERDGGSTSGAGGGKGGGTGTADRPAFSEGVGPDDAG